MNKISNLSFVFTEDSFRVDRPKENVGKYEELKDLFLRDRYEALFSLGFKARSGDWSPSLCFLYKVASTFVRELTSQPDLELAREWIRVNLSDDTYNELMSAVPFCVGAEYINRSWLALEFSRLNDVYSRLLNEYNGTVTMFITERSQNLRVPERVFFHLVENNRDENYPFAFMATYSTRDEDDNIVHMPLSYALDEYKSNRDKLLKLLACLSKVADVSPLLSRFIESGELFHPLRFSVDEAYQFLLSVEDIERCGVVCRIPNWWKNKSSSVSMQVTLGDNKPSTCGFDALISMTPQLTVDGVPLTKQEIERLLKETEGLSLLKGKWVEVNHNRLHDLLEVMDKYDGDITLLDAMRLEAGVDEEDADLGALITNGEWLKGMLKNLRQPSTIKTQRVPKEVKADLRSYQKTGFRWLCYMHEMGFGACLADDMGLGKTLQVLTFLEWYYKSHKDGKVLLVVPASLINNWRKEADKFTPYLNVQILHGASAKVLEANYFESSSFLNITTYGMAFRMERLQEETFDYVILDEAQAIKNPGTKQTRAIKKLKAKHKIAMTGTPIENDLTNLWSLFDFLNKGLLGTSEEFRSYVSGINENVYGYEKLRNMISPFILRRLKSDKKIISDLPDKVEKDEYVTLSAKQIVLYKKLVEDMRLAIEDVEGMEKRGIVLAYITKFKQICNHPDQYLGQEAYKAKDSGKFEVLKTLCETIYEKRERVLIFTQYKEIIPYLKKFLEKIFDAEGLVLHGGVAVSKRQKIVDTFNGEDYVPFMILSLKAGGTGLNLTAANHVIHFDRWWNPAVENQATDRAYRIGQDKSVIVHKFISTGTIEEKIDRMLKDKRELADNVIGQRDGAKWITELNNDEIMDMMRLEI